MHISVTQPVGAALNRTTRVLFQPFDIGKWFLLGFCAFLAYLGEGGGVPNFANQFSGSGGGRGTGGGTPSPDKAWQDFINWINANKALVIVGAVVGFIVLFGIGILLTWIKSRGKFMFIDGIVLNRGAVVEPWKAYRSLANSLLGFSIVFGIISGTVNLSIIAGGLWIAWADIQSQSFSTGSTIALVIGGPLLFMAIVASIAITFLLEHLVVPTMYAHNERVMQAWGTVRQEIIAGHVGSIILFFLMKIVLGIVVSLLAIIATCATCCLAALPYLGVVILLPLLVFSRCYSLCFLEQFGPAWMFFNPQMWEVRCKWCGYDLRGVPGAVVCPECGGQVALPHLPDFPPPGTNPPA